MIAMNLSNIADLNCVQLSMPDRLDFGGATDFLQLQPMAESRRNQRGESARQHVKAHYAAASVHV